MNVCSLPNFAEWASVTISKDTSLVPVRRVTDLKIIPVKVYTIRYDS